MKSQDPSARNITNSPSVVCATIKDWVKIKHVEAAAKMETLTSNRNIKNDIRATIKGAEQAIGPSSGKKAIKFRNSGTIFVLFYLPSFDFGER